MTRIDGVLAAIVLGGSIAALGSAHGETVMDIQAMMLESWRAMPEDQQKENAMLAGNARFVLRMTEAQVSDDAVGRAVRAFREALLRGIPSMGGDPIE